MCKEVCNMIRKLIEENRSFRRFDEKCRIHKNSLKALVNLARLSASAANLQPLKYIISSDPVLNKDIFSCLGWAAYLKDWKGPEKGERPAGYIIILQDTKISTTAWTAYDCGIASQSIMLGAREKGLGGCMIGSINKIRLSTVFSIEPHLEIMLVLALGKPAEQVIIDTIGEEKDIKYFRDDHEVHHVPKRKLEDILIN